MQVKFFDADGTWVEVSLPEAVVSLRMRPTNSHVVRGSMGDEAIQILVFEDDDLKLEIGLPKALAEEIGEEMARTKIVTAGIVRPSHG